MCALFAYMYSSVKPTLQFADGSVTTGKNHADRVATRLVCQCR